MSIKPSILVIPRKCYMLGAFRAISKDDEPMLYDHLISREKMSQEMVGMGFGTSILMFDGGLQSNFFARYASLPKEVKTLIGTMHPLFFEGKKNFSRLPDNTRGVGVINIAENRGQLTVEWWLSTVIAPKVSSMSVPFQVDEETLRQSARLPDRDNPYLFEGVPRCLKEHYDSVSSVEQRRYNALKSAISVLNKSLQMGSSFEMLSIAIYAEVSPNKGFTNLDTGFGYRVLDSGGIELIFFALNKG